MKRKMIIIYKTENSYVVKTYKKFNFTEIVKGLVAALSSCTKGMNKIQAKTFTRKVSTDLELCVAQMRRAKDEQGRN